MPRCGGGGLKIGRWGDVSSPFCPSLGFERSKFRSYSSWPELAVGAVPAKPGGSTFHSGRCGKTMKAVFNFMSIQYQIPFLKNPEDPYC